MSEASGGRIPAGARLGRSLRHTPQLDGVRGLAILWVLIAHGGLLGNGNTGVDVFFALSGFLITNLLYSEFGRTGGISFRHFYNRRLRRLGPALIAMVVLVGAFSAMGVVFRYSWEGRPWSFPYRAFSTLFFMNNWIVGATSNGGAKLAAFSPTWSLASEEQFYFVWPLALFLLLRWRAKPWMIGLLLAGLIAGLIVSVPYAFHLLPHYNRYFSPLDRFAELFAGCLAAVIWQHGGLVLKAFRPALLGWLATAYLVYLLGGAYELHLSTRQTFLSAVLAGAVLILCLVQQDEGLLRRAFTFSPLRYLGRISYGLYLYQLPIDMVIKRYLPQEAWPVNNPANFVILFVSSVAVSALSWHFMESRFLRRRNSTDPGETGRPAPAPAPAAASDAPLGGVRAAAVGALDS